MLNYSLSQLTQICIGDIELSPAPLSERDVEQQHADGLVTDAGALQCQSSKRPSLVRRRTTRRTTLSEPASSRSRRLTHAVSRHRYTSFFVLYDGADIAYISEAASGPSPCFAPFECAGRARRVEIVVFTRIGDGAWQRLLRQSGDLNRVELARRPLARNVVLMQFGGTAEAWYRFSEGDHHLPPRTQSYSYGQIMRLLTISEYINDAAESIASLKQAVEAVLVENDLALRARDRCRFRHDSMSRFATALAAKKDQIQVDRERIARLSARLKRRTTALRACRERHDEDLGFRAQGSIELTKRSEPLGIIGTEIRRVQRVLIADLCAIYPVDSVTRRIRDVAIPQHFEPTSMGPREAAGLGFVAHFVLILSHYLALPLRYPIRAAGSTSYIIDPVSIMPTTSDPTYLGPPYSPRFERRYPLFSMRGANERLSFAVFLLSKDIEQLLQGRGLVCGDLRDHLGNLTALTFWITSITEEEDRELHQRARARRSQSLGQSREHEQSEIVDHADVLRASQQLNAVTGSRGADAALLRPIGSADRPTAMGVEELRRIADKEGGERFAMTQLAESLPIADQGVIS